MLSLRSDCNFISNLVFVLILLRVLIAGEVEEEVMKNKKEDNQMFTCKQLQLIARNIPYIDDYIAFFCLKICSFLQRQCRIFYILYLGVLTKYV